MNERLEYSERLAPAALDAAVRIPTVWELQRMYNGFSGHLFIPPAIKTVLFAVPVPECRERMSRFSIEAPCHSACSTPRSPIIGETDSDIGQTQVGRKCEHPIARDSERNSAKTQRKSLEPPVLATAAFSAAQLALQSQCGKRRCQ